ncbi:O-antigen ligase family protein [Parabacteroides pacaensis]|uniref:O-antigen ligase family protein n=1 Tax=Parabacteroides pacaensis TaxID=2086575 RepID=UPI000D108942|nr:hypothetical protein [Parabacteroides pacaensis]
MKIKKLFSLIIYYIFLWGLLPGVILYDFIAKNGFTYTDELLAFFIVIFYIIRAVSQKKISKELILFSVIACFYLFYSFYIHVNVKNAILLDFFIQVKPFLTFYCIYNLPVFLTVRQRSSIKYICILFAGIFLLLGLSGESNLFYFMGHPSRFATAVTVLGLMYFYCSKRRKKDIWIMLGILSIGLLSFKSKFYAFYAACICIFLFFNLKEKGTFSPRLIVISFVSAVLIGYVSWSKFSYYFIEGMKNEDNMFARPALYVNSYYILNDYFPFGSGFGSYATFASAQYYSPIYYQYHMNKLHGLSPAYSSFIADTYYPVMAQFGYVGVFLLILFWYGIYKKAKRNYSQTLDIQLYKTSLLIILFFIIESTSDSTFTHNRGMYVMMILAMLLAEGKEKASLAMKQ